MLYDITDPQDEYRPYHTIQQVVADILTLAVSTETRTKGMLQHMGYPVHVGCRGHKGYDGVYAEHRSQQHEIHTLAMTCYTRYWTRYLDILPQHLVQKHALRVCYNMQVILCISLFTLSHAWHVYMGSPPCHLYLVLCGQVSGLVRSMDQLLAKICYQIFGLLRFAS